MSVVFYVGFIKGAYTYMTTLVEQTFFMGLALLLAGCLSRFYVVISQIKLDTSRWYNELYKEASAKSGMSWAASLPLQESVFGILPVELICEKVTSSSSSSSVVKRRSEPKRAAETKSIDLGEDLGDIVSLEEVLLLQKKIAESSSLKEEEAPKVKPSIGALPQPTCFAAQPINNDNGKSSGNGNNYNSFLQQERDKQLNSQSKTPPQTKTGPFSHLLNTTDPKTSNKFPNQPGKRQKGEKRGETEAKKPNTTLKTNTKSFSKDKVMQQRSRPQKRSASQREGPEDLLRVKKQKKYNNAFKK